MVEGAGGFYSPLCIDGLNADLADMLGGDLIIVIKDRLGCINQTLLTIEAAKKRGLKILAIVLNQYREIAARKMREKFEAQGKENMEAGKKYIDTQNISAD